MLARWSFARRQYEKHRERLEYYFEHFGGATVFVGRFVAVGRAFVPFTAGLSGMRLRQFAPIAVVGGLVWASVVVGLGYTLGSNWSLIEKWLKSLSAGIVVLAHLDRPDGRAVAIGRPAPNPDRRGVESPSHRTLRLRPDSVREFRPRPLLAAQLPGTSSDGWSARGGCAGVAVRRYRGRYLGPGTAGWPGQDGGAVRRRSAHARGSTRP